MEPSATNPASNPSAPAVLDSPPQSPLGALHGAAGAEFGSWFGVQLPSRFGNSGEEYRLARRTVVLLDTNYRAVFELTGPDRVRYLNAVLTSNIRDLAPGQSAIGLLLNAQGHILAELETLALEDRFFIFGHKSVGERTAQALDKLIIMDDATLRDQTAAHGTLAVEGPGAAQVVREVAGIDLAALAPRDHVAASVATPSGTLACRLLRRGPGGWPFFGYDGAEFLAPRETLTPLWAVLADAARRHGGAPMGYAALEALRLEAGIPWFGADFDENHIPHEAALESTHISFTKGCYPGQEIVERVRSRGHVNRRLTGVVFAGTQVPTPGAMLLAEGAEAGRVTSAAFSPLAGKPIGLAYIRREQSQPGQVLQCGVSSAEVIELPLSGALPTTK